MAKLGVVRRGWKLLRVLTVRVEPARLTLGKVPHFAASTETVPGGWRGGERWPSSPTPLPNGLPGVV